MPAGIWAPPRLAQGLIFWEVFFFNANVRLYWMCDSITLISVTFEVRYTDAPRCICLKHCHPLLEKSSSFGALFCSSWALKYRDGFMHLIAINKVCSLSQEFIRFQVWSVFSVHHDCAAFLSSYISFKTTLFFLLLTAQKASIIC